MLCGIFFYRTQKEEENMHNNIYCAGGRMCAKENTPHYPQKAAQWKNNAFSSFTYSGAYPFTFRQLIRV